MVTKESPLVQVDQSESDIGTSTHKVGSVSVLVYISLGSGWWGGLRKEGTGEHQKQSYVGFAVNNRLLITWNKNRFRNPVTCSRFTVSNIFHCLVSPVSPWGVFLRRFQTLFQSRRRYSFLTSILFLPEKLRTEQSSLIQSHKNLQTTKDPNKKLGGKKCRGGFTSHQNLNN